MNSSNHIANHSNISSNSIVNSGFSLRNHFGYMLSFFETTTNTSQDNLGKPIHSRKLTTGKKPNTQNCFIKQPLLDDLKNNTTDNSANNLQQKVEELLNQRVKNTHPAYIDSLREKIKTAAKENRIDDFTALKLLNKLKVRYNNIGNSYLILTLKASIKEGNNHYYRNNFEAKLLGDETSEQLAFNAAYNNFLSLNQSDRQQFLKNNGLSRNDISHVDYLLDDVKPRDARDFFKYISLSKTEIAEWEASALTKIINFFWNNKFLVFACLLQANAFGKLASGILDQTQSVSAQEFAENTEMNFDSKNSFNTVEQETNTNSQTQFQTNQHLQQKLEKPILEKNLFLDYNTVCSTQGKNLDINTQSVNEAFKLKTPLQQLEQAAKEQNWPVIYDLLIAHDLDLSTVGEIVVQNSNWQDKAKNAILSCSKEKQAQVIQYFLSQSQFNTLLLFLKAGVKDNVNTLEKALLKDVSSKTIKELIPFSVIREEKKPEILQSLIEKKQWASLSVLIKARVFIDDPKNPYLLKAVVEIGYMISEAEQLAKVSVISSEIFETLVQEGKWLVIQQLAELKALNHISNLEALLKDKIASSNVQQILDALLLMGLDINKVLLDENFMQNEISKAPILNWAIKTKKYPVIKEFINKYSDRIAHQVLLKDFISSIKNPSIILQLFEEEINEIALSQTAESSKKWSSETLDSLIQPTKEVIDSLSPKTEIDLSNYAKQEITSSKQVLILEGVIEAFAKNGFQVPAVYLKHENGTLYQFTEKTELQNLPDSEKLEPEMLQKIKDGYLLAGILGIKHVEENYKTDTNGKLYFVPEKIEPTREFCSYPSNLFKQIKRVKQENSTRWDNMDVYDYTNVFNNHKKNIIQSIPNFQGSYKKCFELSLDMIVKITAYAGDFQESKYKPSYAFGVLKHFVNLFNLGISEKLPKQLIQSPTNGNHFIDPVSQKVFGSLRGEDSVMVDFDNYLEAYGMNYRDFYARILMAHGNDSKKKFSKALQYYISTQRTVDGINYYFPGGYESMEEAYKFLLDKLFEKSPDKAKKMNIMVATHQALTLAVLDAIEFSDGRNNFKYTLPERKVIVYRTENSKIVKKLTGKNSLTPGDKITYTTASVVSTSIGGVVQITYYCPDNSCSLTRRESSIINVFGSYMPERAPKNNKGAFPSENENEFLVMTNGAEAIVEDMNDENIRKLISVEF